MAKLSQLNKYTIQGMLSSGKTVRDISTTLDITEKTVQKYVDGELDKIHSTIAKVQIEQAETPIEPPTPQTPIKPDLSAMNKLPKGQAKRTMARTTAGGKDGVAVMTPGASSVGDDFLKAFGKTKSRTSRRSLYDNEGNLKE